MKILGVISGLALLTGAVTTAHAACVSPPAVQTYLSQNPDWKVLDETALTADDKALWSQTYAGQCPGIASADIAGAGKPAYAIALLKTTEKETQQQIVLIDGSTTTTLRVPRPTTKPAVVRVAPPGEYKDVETEKSVKTTQPGFIVQTLEGAAAVFYLVGGKMTSIWISD